MSDPQRTAPKHASGQVLVRLPVELVDRLVPGQLEEANGLALTFSEDEREQWIAGRVGIFVAQALHDISVQAHERREALLKLLDQVAGG